MTYSVATEWLAYRSGTTYTLYLILVQHETSGWHSGGQSVTTEQNTTRSCGNMTMHAVATEWCMLQLQNDVFCSYRMVHSAATE